MKSEIQELFDKAVEISGVVGAQLSVIKDGQQFDFAHGLANAELNIPMTDDTLIQVGSATKVFNAMMIMSLVEEGKLDLDAPVKSYIPEFELADSKAARTITLRHLLSMSAGIDNGDYGDYGTGEDAVAKRVAALKTLPQHFAPGTNFGYSNAGTDITGYVAERVTGRIWDDLLRERVLAPAGLKYAASLDRDRFYHRVSVGHAVDPQSGKVSVVRPWCISRGLAPAGGTFTASAHELARLGLLFVNKGLADGGERVLSETSIATMMTPQIASPVHYQANAWGVGPCILEWDGVTIWGHRGGNISGASYVYALPENNGAMAWIVNTPSLLNRFEKVIVQVIMKAVFGIAKPVIRPPATPLRIDPQRYTGSYKSIGGRCVIEVDDDNLVMKKITKDFGNEAIEYAENVALTALGDDRFLIDHGRQTDPHVLPDDMAFFGDDGHGHTTNATHFVFPYSKKQ